MNIRFPQTIRTFFKAHALWLILGATSLLLAASLVFVLPMLQDRSSASSETTSDLSPAQTKKPGNIATDAGGLSYRSLSQDTCMITGIGTCLEEELVIPNKNPDGKRIVAIGERAFADCTFLTSISISAEIQSIAPSAFVGCSSLVLFDVERDNEQFCSANGVLYSKDKSCLLCYPPNKATKTYLLPSDVKRIASYAFYGNRNLTHLLYEKTVDNFRNIEIDEGNSLLSTVTVTCNYVGAKG